jgi:thymidylate synthase
MFAGEFESLPAAWWNLLWAIHNQGFTSLTEYGTLARQINFCQLLIRDYKPAWHPQDAWCSIPGQPDVPSQKLLDYIQEFTYEYVEKQKKATGNQKFVYNYMGRFLEPVDQVAAIRKKLASGPPYSKRLVLSTWQPQLDLNTDSPPCLQEIWVYPQGNRLADVGIVYRSWDVAGAMEGNVIAEVKMVDDLILAPARYKVGNVCLFGYNCHYYKTDEQKVREILKRC